MGSGGCGLWQPPGRWVDAVGQRRDIVGWKAFVAGMDEFMQTMIGDPTAGFTGTLGERDIGPCPMYVVTPEGVRRG